MELLALKNVVEGLINGLPEQVTDKLEEVDFVIADSPADATRELIGEAAEDAKERGETLSVVERKELTIADDAKGCFLGDPLEKTDDEDPDSEESDIKYDAEGYIVMCACNIANPEEALLVFLHEVGHALGLDEEAVKELGLAASQAKEGTPDVPTSQPNG